MCVVNVYESSEIVVVYKILGNFPGAKTTTSK